MPSLHIHSEDYLNFSSPWPALSIRSQRLHYTVLTKHTRDIEKNPTVQGASPAAAHRPADWL